MQATEKVKPFHLVSECPRTGLGQVNRHAHRNFYPETAPDEQLPIPPALAPTPATPFAPAPDSAAAAAAAAGVPGAPDELREDLRDHRLKTIFRVERRIRAAHKPTTHEATNKGKKRTVEPR